MTGAERHITVLHLDEQRGLRGGERQAGWLMAWQVRMGHQVYAAGRPGAPFLSNQVGGPGISRIPLSLRAEWDLLSARQIAVLCRREGIHIIHAHTSHAHGIALWAAAMCARSRRPRVVVSRRVDFVPRPHRFNRWKYSRPDAILCVSGKVYETLREWGCDPSRLRVVHSAVDEDRLNVAPLSRNALGAPEEGPLIVTAGALEPHKDHAALLEAFARISPMFPGACLVIAGDGSLRAALEDRARVLGVAQAVRFLGFRPDAPAVIAAGDVYVSSSWSEGLGTSILEAMGLGVPVVAARAGGAEEMIMPGLTGWLIPSRDSAALAEALWECLADRGEAFRRAARAQRLARGYYASRRMAAHTLAAYARVLGFPVAGADPDPCPDPLVWLEQNGMDGESAHRAGNV